MLVSMNRLAAFALMACGLSAQPRFEVASVKPSAPNAPPGSMNGGPLGPGPFNQGEHNPDRIRWTNVRLLRVIQVAYDFPVADISGPDWLASQGYDILATVPTATSEGDFRLMLQNLLAERFKLIVHRGTRQVSGFALEVAKGGPKITPSKGAAALATAVADSDSKPSPAREQALQYMATRTPAFNALVSIDENGYPMPRPGNPTFPPGAGFSVTIVVNGRNRSTALNMPMPEVAKFLGNLAGGPAEDHTGLSGKYDVHLEYVADPTADPGPTVADAVEQQLGLKLTPLKIPVSTLFIDHAEKIPVEN